MDALVQTMMKGAVKCIRHCELQNSVNQWAIERILCFWDLPANMLESVPYPVFVILVQTWTGVWVC